VPQGIAFFGPPLTDEPVMGEVACLIDDGFDPTQLNGCSAVLDPGSLAGKIALVDRGTCAFSAKVRTAQDAGAIGAIVVNSAGTGILNLGGTDAAVTIPSVGVGSYDGNLIREAVCPDAALFLQDYRFQVTSRWHSGGEVGPAKAAGMTDSAGFFSFFDPSNLEVVTKVLNACTFLDGYLIGLAGLTNVGVDLTLLDMVAGGGLSTSVEEGTPFPAIFDVAGVCP
jgi:hypothetical protein